MTDYSASFFIGYNRGENYLWANFTDKKTGDVKFKKKLCKISRTKTQSCKTQIEVTGNTWYVPENQLKKISQLGKGYLEDLQDCETGASFLKVRDNCVRLVNENPMDEKVRTVFTAAAAIFIGESDVIEKENGAPNKEPGKLDSSKPENTVSEPIEKKETSKPKGAESTEAAPKQPKSALKESGKSSSPKKGVTINTDKNISHEGEVLRSEAELKAWKSKRRKELIVDSPENKVAESHTPVRKPRETRQIGGIEYTKGQNSFIPTGDDSKERLSYFELLESNSFKIRFVKSSEEGFMHPLLLAQGKKITLNTTYLPEPNVGAFNNFKKAFFSKSSREQTKFFQQYNKTCAFSISYNDLTRLEGFVANNYINKSDFDNIFYG